MSYEYSWEKETETIRWDRVPQDTIWDSPEVWVEPIVELEDEEEFLSLEENPDMEEWLMRNV